MSDEMRRIRRQMRGPDAHEARARMLARGQEKAERVRGSVGQLPAYFGIGKRRVVLEVEEQFSEAWFAMALVLTFIGLVFHVDALLVIAAILLTIVALSWVWNRLALFGLEYRRSFSVRRAFVGETVELELSVANRKFLPLSWLRISDTFPLQLPLEELEISKRGDTNRGELNTFWSLKWYQQSSRVYHIRAARRGFFHYGPVKLETGDIFGLFRTSQRREEEQVLIVYPRVVPLTGLGLPAKEPFGDLRAPRFMFEDPIRTVGIRDYRPEDDFRRLHWKATARRQQLQTRVLEPASSHNLMVCLNVATLEQPWKGVIPELLEQAVSVAASVSLYSIEQRWPTGLLANGALPRSDQPIKILPGRSPAQITAILELLAAVTPFATAPFERLLAAESPRLPWGSTLVIISPILTPALIATLIDLKATGRRLVLLSLDDAPPPDSLEGILVYKIPRGEMTDLIIGPPIHWELSHLTPEQQQRLTIQQVGRGLRHHPGPI
ncbi:MAG: DUF58 domain-containing protein [Caldilineae bacterium]|nr:MAG: DUF58 domain-containing protein [Caldilineae bacterium]